jgi:hypothetical protein
MKKYITTPEDAIKELAPILSNKRQVEALKVLAEHIEMSRHQDKEAHWLFGKLFLYIFDKNMIHYKSSQGAIDSIRMALEKPMDSYFKLIADVYDNQVDTDFVRSQLAEKINLMLNDKKFYN